MNFGTYFRHGKKQTVESHTRHCEINLTKLNEYGLIKPGATTCRYYGREFGVTWTAQRLGGQRAWMVCPKCQAKRTKLYMRDYVSCRACLGLVHESTRLPLGQRLGKRAEKIRAEFGWKPGIANPEGERPPEMKMRRFIQKLRVYYDLRNRAIIESAREIGMNVDRF